MNKLAFHLTAVLILSCFFLLSCSRSKDPSQTKESNQTSTEQAARAIKEYGRNPIDKARTAQQLGEERMNAVDEAVKQK